MLLIESMCTDWWWPMRNEVSFTLWFMLICSIIVCMIGYGGYRWRGSRDPGQCAMTFTWVEDKQFCLATCSGAGRPEMFWVPAHVCPESRPGGGL